jgi:hypothetical protein
VHNGYEFHPVSIPVLTFEETLAEKLAALRRRALLRDLYDVAWFGRQGAFDEELIRELTYLKVYVDVVEEGRGARPFDPAADLFSRRASDFPPEDIGLLGGDIQIDDWLEIVKRRFRFLTYPTASEARWARCDPRDARSVSEAVAAFGHSGRE